MDSKEETTKLYTEQEEKGITLDVIDDTNQINKSKEKKHKGKSRVKKIVKRTLVTIGIILLLYIIFNFICSIIEENKVKSYNYGQTINVNGHKMVVNIKGENNAPTIVFLTGYIVCSPVLFYKPLLQLLSEKYKVVTIEPFNYGLSDIVEEDRNAEKIVPELHSCIEQLQLKNYYLMAHSLGGIYSVYYANKYPNEVSGFIGFDNAVPKLIDYSEGDPKDLGQGASKLNIVNFLGLNRMASLFNHRSLISVYLYDKYNYTSEEIDMFRNIALARGYNKGIRNEGNEGITKSYKISYDMKFPKNIPLVHFLSSSLCKMAEYKQLHVDIGNESILNEVIELKGKHGFFLFEHNDVILENINKIMNVTKIQTN